jgi:CBS-domain-containing membrane protein
MLSQNSLFDLPSFDSVIDLSSLTASANTLVVEAIAQVMTRKLVTLKRSRSVGGAQSPNQIIFTALSLLHRHRIHHLPILDERGQLYGLVTPGYIRQILQPINRVIEGS